MLNKIKKSLNTAKDTTARNFQYAKGKTSGFKHPDQVEPHIQALRADKETIPRLYERLQKISGLEKELSMAESKAYNEWTAACGMDRENKGLENYMRAWAECQLSISEARNIFFATIEEIRIDMKTIREKDLSEIQSLHDKVNRALTDSIYWRGSGNPSKMADSESKYKQYACELIEMKNNLVQVKEDKFPNYIIDWNRSEVEFYSRALEAANDLQSKLSNFGPIEKTVFTPLNPSFFDIGTASIIDESGNSQGDGEYRGERSSYDQTPHNPNITTMSSMPPPSSSSSSFRNPQMNTQNSNATATAQYDFATDIPEELPFSAGDILTIKEKSGDWWQAEMNGRTGLIPSNYVRLN